MGRSSVWRKGLAGLEGVGVERDPHPAGLVDVALVVVGVVLRQQQIQVAVLDGIDAGGDVAVADGHHARGVLRRTGPDDVVAAAVLRTGGSCWVLVGCIVGMQ